ncbi:MFS transporter [Actinomadura keratinilytica]|jgi:GPH family glycoside/pentoside/hexuronide:cation symporter|uniref:MFS transporter n=1 Tax=Actinomadura keratinilytica TaxID=547461 RepID=A0ABP7Z9Y5_9ACTN
MRSAPLPRSLRIGYGIGSFGTGTFSTVPGLLLLYYLTNVLDVPAGVAGVAVFVPKAWDLLINPLVGRWSDRTVSRHGARRPWLLAGALTLPPLFALMFAGTSLRGVPAALYVGGWFVLAATAYALFEVPYKAMPAEMTDDYHEQSVLLTWRMAFLGVAILLSGGLAPLLVNSRGGDPTIPGYRLMGLVIGAVMLAGLLGAYFGTARAPRIVRCGPDRPAAHATLRRQLAAARGNRPFVLLACLGCAQMLAAGIMLASAPYFASYILADTGAITTIFLALIGPMVLVMPGWVAVSRRYGKRGAMVVAAGLFLLGGACLTLTPAFGAAYAHLSTMLVGVGYAGLQLLQFSMLADTLVYDELRSGANRAGVFTGLWTALETVTMALGAMVFGWLLGAAGFISSDPDKPVAQPDSAVDAILFGGTLLPVVLTAASIALTARYDLTAQRLDDLRAHRHPVSRPAA